MARFLSLPVLALVALTLVLPVAAGCSSGPDATDVSMVYCRKQSEHQPAVIERVFNESHTQWIDKRSDRRATMLVPEGDSGYYLAKRPEDLVIPVSYASRLSIEPRDRNQDGPDDPHTVFWEGEMTYDEFSELRGASAFRPWQVLIATIYRGNREIEAAPEGLGYSPRDLPPGTFAADDEIMRAVPRAFQQLHFFESGLAASDEGRAHGWFVGQPMVRECLILTVDGVTTLLPLPSMRDCNNNVHVFKKRHEEYNKCLTAFAHIASTYRPATVSVGSGGRAAFQEEATRLREQADRDRADLARLARENGGGDGDLAGGN